MSNNWCGIPFILAENAEGLVVVDMHAAHERITYEHLKKSMAEDKLRSQPLLVPVSIAVSQKEGDAAEEFNDTFNTLGFELTRLSPGITTIVNGHGGSHVASQFIGEFF